MSVRARGVHGGFTVVSVAEIRPVLSYKFGYTVSMSKIMVSLPDELVAELDSEATRRSTSRSALLAVAARRELARRDPQAVADAIARSERRFSGAGIFDAADLVRGDRDDRR